MYTYLQRARLSAKSCRELEVVGILLAEFVKQLPCTDEVGIRVVIHGEESSQGGRLEETARSEQSGFCNVLRGWSHCHSGFSSHCRLYARLTVSAVAICRRYLPLGRGRVF